MGNGFVESTKEASRGGFQGIKKIRGLLLDLQLVPPPETWDSTAKQLLVTMEDVTILEMFPGEEMFELKDGKFSFYVPYAEEGKTPHKNSVYMRCWVASAEKLGKKPSEFKGRYVTLDKQKVLLFQRPLVDEATKKPKVDAEGKKILENIETERHFCFVADEVADGQNTKDYIKGLILGLNEKAALRKLLVDPRAKQYGEFKDALNNGTIAELLGIKLDNGKFAEK